MSGTKDKPRPGPPLDILAFVNHLDHQGARMRSTTVAVKDQVVHRLSTTRIRSVVYCCSLCFNSVIAIKSFSFKRMPVVISTFEGYKQTINSLLNACFDFKDGCIFRL